MKMHVMLRHATLLSFCAARLMSRRQVCAAHNGAEGSLLHPVLLFETLFL